MEKIMVVNTGSSSLKFQLIDMPMNEDTEQPVVLIEGGFERIGIENPALTIKWGPAEARQKEERILTIKNHSDAVVVLKDLLLEKGIVKDLHEIAGVGHRFVHGGVNFIDPVVLTPSVLAELETVIDFAPVHNDAHIKGIKGFYEALPDVLQVIVFDTAFHKTMPDEAYRYACPKEWYDNYKIRKYGFHGTSHKYVSQEAAKLLGRPVEELRIVTAHLGNGASLCAVKHGKCVDTSMGFTPLDGLPMGTRSGVIDPSCLDFVAQKEGKTTHELIEILNKKSGYLGFTGKSDARDVRQMQQDGVYEADLIIRMQEKKIADFVSSYYGYMGGCDALVFTAGIGEKSPQTRYNVCERLREAFGIEIDAEKNQVWGEVAIVSKPTSKVAVLVIPTNEELMIAREVMKFKKELNR